MRSLSIAIVGDFNPQKHTHLALNDSVAHAQAHLPFALHAQWIPTRNLIPGFFDQHPFDGIWVAPGSPYEHDAGVYAAIRWARETNFPLLGSCGGFQYMVVEYAANVLGMRGAGHEESEPHYEQLVISKLACSLKGQQETVNITDPDAWLFRVLKTRTITGFFNCSFGVNPVYVNQLNGYPFMFTAFSTAGEPRAVELKTHPFFHGTLFQPPLDSHPEKPNPLLMDFFMTCAARSGNTIDRS